MKELSLDEIKKCEIQILDYIDSVCKKFKLSYFLAWGTLLGAVRHAGFIPWDDDVDIMMPRDDYERLQSIISDENNKYIVLSHQYEKEYYYPFAKVVDSSTMVIENGTVKATKMGVWVDIFPIDSLPNDERLRKRIQDKCWAYRQIWGHALVWKAHTIERGFVYKAGCFICNLYGWKRAIERLEKVATSVQGPTDYVSELIECNHKYDTMPAVWFASSVNKKFEGKDYPVPIGYDGYLTTVYGDYMKLPPVDERVSNHNFVAYRVFNENYH